MTRSLSRRACCQSGPGLIASIAPAGNAGSAKSITMMTGRPRTVSPLEAGHTLTATSPSGGMSTPCDTVPPPSRGTMAHPFVGDIREHDRVQGTFLAVRKSLLQSRSGSPYLSVTLADRSGEMEARIWDDTDRFDQ